MDIWHLAFILAVHFGWIAFVGCKLSGDELKGRTLTVSTMLMRPFVMVRCANSSAPKEAHQTVYEGYMVDILNYLADHVGFSYRLAPVYDGEFGVLGVNGEWNGMIGELLRNEVDIAAAPMYVTRRRKKVVAFTKSFHDVEAAVVMRADSTDHMRMSELLQAQPEIKFGTAKEGAIFRALRKSNDTVMRAVFSRMSASPEVSFTSDIEEGLARVRRDPSYAYLMQDVIASYKTSRAPCDLKIVGKLSIGEYFGIATRKGSGLIPGLNRGIDQLREERVLEKLFFKWWWKDDQCYDFVGKSVIIRSGSNQLQRYRSSATPSARSPAVQQLILPLAALLALKGLCCDCSSFLHC